MKSNTIIAAAILVAAMLTPAQATQILFTSPTGNLGTTETYASASGSVTAYGFIGGVISGTATAANLIGNGSPAGLGLQTSNNAIQWNDFIQIDFSNVKSTVATQGQTITQLQFALDIVQSNSNLSWHVYGTNTPESATNNTVTKMGVTLLAQGTLAPTGFVNPIVFSGSGTLYNYYIIAVDCPTSITGGLDIASMTITTSARVPEPATFFVTGAALIGLGLTFRKRRKA